jgi:hypothetical protein
MLRGLLVEFCRTLLKLEDFSSTKLSTVGDEPPFVSVLSFGERQDSVVGDRFCRVKKQRENKVKQTSQVQEPDVRPFGTNIGHPDQKPI